MLRERLTREILDDLRTHGVVAGNRAVEVLRAVSAMLTDTDAGRHSGECLIAAIARRTGLRVRIENATVFTQVLGPESGTELERASGDEGAPAPIRPPTPPPSDKG